MTEARLSIVERAALIATRQDWAQRGALEAAVEAILAARLAAPFACQTHLCGVCGGCKANQVEDLLTAAQARLAAAWALAGEWERMATANEVARGRNTKVAGYYRRHAIQLRRALTAAPTSDAGAVGAGEVRS